MLDLHINLSQLRHNKNDLITGTLPCYNKFHLWNSCLLLTNCCSGKKDSCLSNILVWFPALFITCKLMTEAVDFSSLHGFFSFFEVFMVFFPFLYVSCLSSLAFMGFFPFLYVFCMCSLVFMGFFPFFMFSECVL